MQKISSQEAQALLKQAGAAIRSLIEDNKDLREKLAAVAFEERVEKLARQMEDKRLNDELTFEEKVAQLRQADNLDVTEEAIKLAAPQMSFGGPSDVPGGGSHPFEHFILTGEDPR